MLVFGVLLAVVAFGGVLIFGAGSGSAQPAPVTTVKVVTAAADVTLGTALDLPQLGTVDMDVALAVDTYHDPNQLVGMVVRRTVHQGDAFKSSDFQSSAGVDAAQVAANLKAGQVAIALNIDGLTGVGGLIQAGDYVDVILATAVPIVLDNSTGGSSGGSGGSSEPFTKVGDVANNTSVKVLVQNVQVLGMGGAAAASAASAANGTDASSTATDPNTGKPLATTALVILSVTSQEAEMIRFGQADADAMLSLALRSPADAAAADVKTTGITLRELVDKYGVLPPRAIISQFP